MSFIARTGPSKAATIAAVVLMVCASSARVRAQEPPGAPAVPAAGKDWVKLTSGEWLQGEIKSMRNESMEFDSEKLDVLKLDWSDVAEIRSGRDLQYVLADGRTATGAASMQAGVVKVRAGTEVRELPANQLVSIVTGAKKEWDRWSGKASLGFVTWTGNTDQTDINSLAFIRRDGARTRFDVNYTANYGELSGARSVNNRFFGTRIDAFLTQRLFVTPVAIDISADEFQNIDLRSTLSAGLGYDLVKRKTTDLHLQVAGGYVNTNYRSVAPGESDPDESGAVIPSVAFSWDPTGDIETDLTYDATITVPEVSDAFHHLVGLMSIDLYGWLDVTFSVAWDRTESPKATDDGSIPDRDDFRTSFGLGIDF